MSNIFASEFKPQLVYDIKGAWVGRYNKGDNSIQKDLDLNKHIIVSKHVREKIIHQLNIDSQFLMKCNIMDYSLLLGVYNVTIMNNEKRKKKLDKLKNIGINDNIRTNTSNDNIKLRKSLLDDDINTKVIDSQIISGNF